MKIKGLTDNKLTPDERLAIGVKAVADAMIRNQAAAAAPKRPVEKAGRLMFEDLAYIRVFSEDECLRHDPTATKIADAFYGFTGAQESFATIKPDVRFDDGDGWTDVYRGLGVIVVSSFDGSTLYVEERRLPYAALYGSPWTFEDWKRVADGLQQMRERRDPERSSTYRLVALGDLTHAVAGVFQNPRPMNKDEVLDALRLLADFNRQIPNAVQELQALSDAATRRLNDACTKINDAKAKVS